jgi:hypothetical protein
VEYTRAYCNSCSYLDGTVDYLIAFPRWRGLLSLRGALSSMRHHGQLLIKTHATLPDVPPLVKITAVPALRTTATLPNGKGTVSVTIVFRPLLAVNDALAFDTGAHQSKPKYQKRIDSAKLCCQKSWVGGMAIVQRGIHHYYGQDGIVPTVVSAGREAPISGQLVVTVHSANGLVVPRDMMAQVMRLGLKDHFFVCHPHPRARIVCYLSCLIIP